jgi:hypothetical protein
MVSAGTLAANVERVRRRIARAAERSGRDPSTVRLVAVTKTVGAPLAAELLELGVVDLGENRVSAMLEKARAIAAARWHFVGHLQRNKATRAARVFHLLHSLDSIDLARLLDRCGEIEGRPIRVLVQVNVSGEGTKSGVPPERTSDLLRDLRALTHVRVEGLMTMAPAASEPESARPVFRALREARDRAAGEGLLPLPGELSMGMTQDFEIAVEEGATIVRVGSALFEAEAA